MDEFYKHKNESISDRNWFLNRAFASSMFFGFGVWGSAVAIRYGQSIDFGYVTDYLNNSDQLKYYASHVKGMGQAIYYTQGANMACGAVKSFCVKDEVKDEAGVPNVVPIEDHSVKLGALCLVTGFALEKFTQYERSIESVKVVFDSADMGWYGVGVVSLIAFNKAACAIADNKYKVELPTAPNRGL